MFKKIADSAVFNSFVLALVVTAWLILFKGGAGYLPDGGVGGTIKHLVQGV